MEEIIKSRIEIIKSRYLTPKVAQSIDGPTYLYLRGKVDALAELLEDIEKENLNGRQRY